MASNGERGEESWLLMGLARIGVVGPIEVREEAVEILEHLLILLGIGSCDINPSSSSSHINNLSNVLCGLLGDSWMREEPTTLLPLRTDDPNPRGVGLGNGGAFFAFLVFLAVLLPALPNFRPVAFVPFFCIPSAIGCGCTCEWLMGNCCICQCCWF